MQAGMLSRREREVKMLHYCCWTPSPLIHPLLPSFTHPDDYPQYQNTAPVEARMISREWNGNIKIKRRRKKRQEGARQQNQERSFDF